MSHCPQFKHWDQKWLLLWIFLSQHLASIRSAPSIPGRYHICVKRTGCPVTNTCRRIDTCCPLFTYSRNGHWNDLILYACKCGMQKSHSGLSQHKDIIYPYIQKLDLLFQKWPHCIENIRRIMQYRANIWFTLSSCNKIGQLSYMS